MNLSIGSKVRSEWLGFSGGGALRLFDLQLHPVAVGTPPIRVRSRETESVQIALSQLRLQPQRLHLAHVGNLMMHGCADVIRNTLRKQTGSEAQKAQPADHR